MSDPTRSDFTRPADLAGASLRELLDAWNRHTARLVDARHGLGDTLPAARSPATVSTSSPSGRRSSTS